jgi:opacity protein-like surface antigen
MKTCSCKLTRFVLMISSAGLVLGARPLLAGDDNSGFYLSTDAGINLADNLTVSSGSISLSPGLRCDLSAGYAFRLSNQFTLAPEVETGVIYNSLDQASSGGVSAPVDGSYTQVPLLANVVLNWQFSAHWVAHVGGGAGYDFNSLNVTSVAGINTDTVGSETDFAWQGMAGIGYTFGPGELGLSYKYLAVKPSGLQTVGNNSICLSYMFHF